MEAALEPEPEPGSDSMAPMAAGRAGSLSSGTIVWVDSDRSVDSSILRTAGFEVNMFHEVEPAWARIQELHRADASQPRCVLTSAMKGDGRAQRGMSGLELCSQVADMTVSCDTPPLLAIVSRSMTAADRQEARDSGIVLCAPNRTEILEEITAALTPSPSFRWQVQTDGGWADYGVEQAVHLQEQHDSHKANCELAIGKWTYIINFSLMTQTNTSTGKSRKIRKLHQLIPEGDPLRRTCSSRPIPGLRRMRMDMIEDLSRKNDLFGGVTPRPSYVEVSPGDPQWQRIEARIQDSLPHHRIIALSAIQNEKLEERFRLKQFEMISNNSPCTVRKDLFHSVSKDEVLNSICLKPANCGGLDPRHSDHGSYGAAAYFAENIAYCIGLRPYSCIINCDGSVTFLVVDVLLGRCKDYGNQKDTATTKLRHGPALPSGEGFYDSVSGTEGSYGIPSGRQDQLWGMAHSFPREPNGSVEYGRQYAIYEYRQSMPRFKVTVQCEKTFTLWDDVVYIKRQPSAGNDAHGRSWYAFKGRHYYRLRSLEDQDPTHGTLGGSDIDGNPMENVDAVAYSGEGQGQNHFYVFKGRKYYRYKHLHHDHDGKPGNIGGLDSEGNPMGDVDGATYTRGAYGVHNWYVVKGRQYYRYENLHDDHDKRPGTLHGGIDGVCGLEFTGGHADPKQTQMKWYVLGTGQHAMRYKAAKYLRLAELNKKPASSGNLAMPKSLVIQRLPEPEPELAPIKENGL